MPVCFGPYEVDGFKLRVWSTLAHMLYIESNNRERPNRTVTVTLLGAPGAPRKTEDGNLAELAWRDEVWSMQSR